MLMKFSRVIIKKNLTSYSKGKRKGSPRYSSETLPAILFYLYILRRHPPLDRSRFEMSCLSVVSPFVLFIVCCCSLIQAQQPYVGKATTNCNNTENSALGYSCNALNKSCQAYLTFRSQPNYNTVASISTLLGSDPSQLAEVNSVSQTETFPSNQLVIVPVNCSCSGEYSQANTSYIVQQDDTLLLLANNIYQGLTTCQALQNQRSTGTTVDIILSGETLTAPLRCACPTKNQSDLGIRYLLSYLITTGDTVSAISERFGAETGKTLEANGLTGQNPTPLSIHNTPNSFTKHTKSSNCSASTTSSFASTTIAISKL
uniref:LysM domain-containing protein n=1 Tax=Salix viminalis TaxID=40686 RepID=A0A6N2NJN5_SALVM